MAKKKPAKKKSTKAKKPAKKSAKPAKKSAKPAKKKPAKKKPAKLPSEGAADVIEVAFTDLGSGPQADTSADTEAATFLKDYEDGNIDNAWDVIGDLAELDKRLSKTSPLRAAFDKMYGELEDICRESSGG